jgi:hypothetical protein
MRAGSGGLRVGSRAGQSPGSLRWGRWRPPGVAAVCGGWTGWWGRQGGSGDIRGLRHRVRRAAKVVGGGVRGSLAGRDGRAKRGMHDRVRRRLGGHR